MQTIKLYKYTRADGWTLMRPIAGSWLRWTSWERYGSAPLSPGRDLYSLSVSRAWSASHGSIRFGSVCLLAYL